MPGAAPEQVVRVAVLLTICLAAACARVGVGENRETTLGLAEEAQRAPIMTEYRLQPGDRISVKFFYNPELNEVAGIRPDGRISLQLLGDVEAAGQSTAELRRDLMERYEPLLRDAEVTVNVESYGSLVSYVGGEVRNPGVIALLPGMTALQAIMAAGGNLRSGNMRNVVIIRDQGTEQPLILMVNLRDSVHSLSDSNDATLHPKDIVIVPMSGIARAGLFVQQYINELLPLAKAFNINYNLGIPGVR